jgi:hypothetical protein
MKAIDKARKDSRVSSLLEELDAKTKLKFSQSKEPGWGSSYGDGIYRITFSSCRHPSASLAHELLHVKTQLNGYKRIRIGISSIDQTESFNRFMTCLDNELQHHKFYDEFISLGFEPHQFYMDEDTETENHLRQEIDNGYEKLIDSVICLFSIIAPGGAMTSTTIEALKTKLYSVNGGAYKESLQKIEELVASWSRSPSFDAVPTIKWIMLVMAPLQNMTWFGFEATNRPPNQGFFVDMPFEVQEPAR